VSWNAGAFGSVRFRDQSAVDAWRRAELGTWTDWIDDIGRSGENVTVAAALADLGEWDRGSDDVMVELTTDGTTLALAADMHEDAFHDCATTIVRAFRTAETYAHQALLPRDPRRRGRFRLRARAGGPDVRGGDCSSDPRRTRCTRRRDIATFSSERPLAWKPRCRA
jgi:hypothetical protein